MKSASTRSQRSSRHDGRYEPFYQLMGNEHTQICSHLCASNQQSCAIYAALLLGRLIFIYFLQQQGLLEGNTHFLQDRLHTCQKTDYPFSHVLRQLTHRFSCRQQASGENLDHIPQLHPSLFEEHSLDSISIPNHIFTRILQCFEMYNWQLHEPEYAEDRISEGCAEMSPTIFPDVLEYSFERYINQKQMGAYYTSADITTYISQHTICSRLFEMLQQHVNCAAAIQNQLRVQPQRYLSPALCSPQRLPDESAREQQARQAENIHICALLRSGQIRHPHQFITYNLNSLQCALDLLAHCDDSAFLRAFYQELRRISILDPTCGSGAFLLAAQATLESLYTACLARMHQTLTTPQSLRNHATADLAFLRSTLARIRAFPNPTFFILHTIANRNLYGVDIMPEAIEICKLRLLLRLVAQLEHPEQLIWLPRTHLHLHTGNTLVGFTSLPSQLHHTEACTEVLDRQLARQTGLDPAKPSAFENWQARHRPFHWCLVFKSVIQRGGFDIIIGNPPYVEYSKIRQDYSTLNHCGNLYAAVIERSLQLCRQAESYLGLVVPLSICGGERFARLRATMRQEIAHLWLANFDIFPCRLFDGAYQRLSILLAQHGAQQPCATSVTGIKRWYARERPHLIERTTYTPTRCDIKPDAFPKLVHPIQEHILRKVAQQAADGCIATVHSVQPTPYFVYYQEATNYWLKATCRVPFYRKNGQIMPPTHGRFLYLKDEQTAYTIMALLNSSLFYIWFVTFSDGFHLSHALVQDFPVSDRLYALPQLSRLARYLEEDIQRNAILSTRNTRIGPGTTRTLHQIELEEYHMNLSKPLLDEIDHTLADHYELTQPELDFVIHYDIKYRMGRDEKQNS